MKVLYVGSGISALQARDEKYNDHIKICLNNAWRVYENSHFDYWIHPSDFPKETFPKEKNYKYEISHSEYSPVLHQSAEKLGFPELTGHALEVQLGYTSFFQGLYWIMLNFSPEKIGLLGFDHDYNQNKLAKWQADGKPSILNSFCNKKEKTISEWSENYFNGFDKDFFYGHGTPDPMRLGSNIIEEKMILAKQMAEKFGIRIVNYSLRNSPFAIFERETI